MPDSEIICLTVSFLIIAVLYAAVGQAGASGYLAAMGLFGIDPTQMKVTALGLNLVVAAIGTFQFWRTGLLSWRSFYPFGVLGFPFSMIGGAIHLPAGIYQPLVGAILIAAAVQMFRSARRRKRQVAFADGEPPFLPALATGAVIGLVSGMTGTGGGIFLAPVILTMNWVSVRHTAAVTAAYNLLNSAAALVGAHSILAAVPPSLPVWLIAVAVGGAFGAVIGSRYLSEAALRYVLAVALAVSGIKMLVY